MTFKKIENLIYNKGTNWVINYYKNLNDGERHEFLELLTKILKYIDNKELFFYNLKYYLKGSNSINNIEYKLLVDAAMSLDDTPLSDDGYKILFEKYKDELHKHLYEIHLSNQSNTNEDQSEYIEEFIGDLI